jgi:hypothetical protein
VFQTAVKAFPQAVADHIPFPFPVNGEGNIGLKFRANVLAVFGVICHLFFLSL